MAARRDQTVYCLPVRAIDALAIDSRRTPPPLDGPQAAAERAFTALCAEFHAVGVHHGRFIDNTPLNDRPAGIRPEDLEFMKQFDGWAGMTLSALEAGLRKVGKVSDRVKGYVGWLLTEPAYLAEVAAVREDWERLPTGQRPHFPLTRPLTGPAEPGSGGGGGGTRAGPALPVFDSRLVAFLDKWALMNLATWDLPVPQGPLVPNLLAPHGPAFPRHGIHITLPVYYPLTGDDDLLAAVLRLQQEAARRVGVGPSGAGLPHHQAYAQLLDVLHLERAARGRFPGPKPPRGLATRVVAAAVACLGLSEDHVSRYRKAIARCLRGERDRVPFLRVAVSARRRG
jgi:hypothetical protein